MNSKFYIFAVAMVMAAVFSGCKKDEPVAPTVVTKTASEITKVSATLKGEITNEGSAPITTCGFYYDSVPDMSYPMVLESKVNGNVFTAALTELNPGTTYYYRAYAVSNAGTSEGEVVRFATVSAVAPTVLTVSASAIAFNGATLNGNVTTEGSDPITKRGFMYGTSETNISTQVECGSGTGTYSTALTGLLASTTYYFKAYATSGAGTSYGEIESFTTQNPTAPFIQTLEATNLSINGVTINGNITSDGGSSVTTRGFYYGTNQGNLTQNVSSGNGTGNFSSTLSGLTQGTRYYYKAYATNSIGTSYGNVKFFDMPQAINGHEYVDLGLPSGMLWATCNVGASTPENYGGRYSEGTSVTWGGNWQTPSRANVQELIGTCSATWTTVNGVNGYRFTGANGKSIFLPAGGDDGGYSIGAIGCYWTKSYYEDITNRWYYYLKFDNDEYSVDNMMYARSFSIRPCCPR